jgi:hypothetical protein
VVRRPVAVPAELAPLPRQLRHSRVQGAAGTTGSGALDRVADQGVPEAEPAPRLLGDHVPVDQLVDAPRHRLLRVADDRGEQVEVEAAAYDRCRDRDLLRRR